MSAKRCPGGKEQEERSVCSEDSVVHRPGVRMGARAGGQGARWPRRCCRTEARLEPNEDQAKELGFTPRFKEEQPAGGDVIHAPPAPAMCCGLEALGAGNTLVKGAALPSRRLPCGRGMREGTANSILTANAVPGRAQSARPLGGGQPALAGRWTEFSLQSPRLWGGRERRRMGALGPESADGPSRQGGLGSSLRTGEARTGPRWRGERFLAGPACRLFFFFLFLTTRVKYRTYG